MGRKREGTVIQKAVCPQCGHALRRSAAETEQECAAVVQHLCARLTAERERQGLSLWQLALRSDVPYNSLWRLVRQHRKPHVEFYTVFKLARALGLGLDTLLDGVDQVAGGHTHENHNGESIMHEKATGDLS
jgi:hypothetical protein